MKIDDLNKMTVRASEFTIKAMPTGSISLDVAIGIGGFPKGRIIDISGPESSGKTTLALLTVASLTRQKIPVYFIDAERSFNASWAKLLGIDLDYFYVVQTVTAEQAFDAMVLLCQNKAAFIVVDSVPALIPQELHENSLEEGGRIASQAGVVTAGLQKLLPHLGDTVIVFINQLRANIGAQRWEEKTTSTGGFALRFYASVRLKVSKIGGSEIKDKAGNVWGHRIKIKVSKNKVGMPFRVAEMNLLFNSGIDREDELVDVLLQQDIVKQKGAWFMLGEEKFQGRDALVAFVKEKKLFDKLQEILYKKIEKDGYVNKDDMPPGIKEEDLD